MFLLNKKSKRAARPTETRRSELVGKTEEIFFKNFEKKIN